MDVLLMVGIAAGLIQMVGYILYLSIKKIDPNPLTWLMFSYGTIVLTVLEWDKNATWAELFLPMTCSILGLVVMGRCWYRARKKEFAASGRARFWPNGFWPYSRWDQLSFGSDLIITAGYICAWLLATGHILAEGDRETAVLAFLILSNLTILTEFIPLIRTTKENPEREHWAPWAVWTLAYSLLGYVTFETRGFWDPLMLYPALNAVMHGWVAWIARTR